MRNNLGLTYFDGFTCFPPDFKFYYKIFLLHSCMKQNGTLPTLQLRHFGNLHFSNVFCSGRSSYQAYFFRWQIKYEVYFWLLTTADMSCFYIFVQNSTKRKLMKTFISFFINHTNFKFILHIFTSILWRKLLLNES